ncbi:MAG: TonB-dependent receptor, partial [Crocinitomicaceae bacterium]
MLEHFKTSLFILLSTFTFAQERYNISGTITDGSSGEEMIGAKISVIDQSGLGTVSNEYGYYTLSLPKGEYILEYSFFGYDKQIDTIQLTQNLLLNKELKEPVLEVDAVVITARKQDDNVRNAQIGVDNLDIRQLEKVPVIFGEKDLIKTMQLKPGVKSGGDGSSGFFVRGGSVDQNLILLDEAPVYNASHLLGFFSTFNSDAIKSATIYKGTQPAYFGGRLSSVLDVRMNEGNTKKYRVSGGIGLISSKLNVEGPIQKDKSSFLISARRTYADVFLKLSKQESLRNSSLYFYDLNTKLNYKLSDKDHLYLSGYFGRDKLGVTDFGLS